MLNRELLQPPPADGGQPQSHHTVVIGVRPPAHQSRQHRPIHQLDRAVMAEEKKVGDVPDRRAPFVLVGAHREKKLMLGRRQADLRGSVLAPAKESAKAHAGVAESSIVVVGERLVR
jgi:hypothetical protein